MFDILMVVKDGKWLRDKRVKNGSFALVATQ